MKKVITYIITAILPLAAMISSLQAQELATIGARSRAAFPAPSAVTGNTDAHAINSSAKSAKDLKKEAREAKQFNKASRDFTNNFSEATEVSWIKQEDGYSASFNKDGLRNIVWYDKGGNVTHQMITYTGKQAPADVKSIVRAAYPDYNITCVKEIHEGDLVAFLVTVEDDSNIKLVTVANGELHIFREYKKAL